MFAVVRTGGKQYRVAAGDKIVVEKLAGDAGETIKLDDVLMAGDGDKLQPTKGLNVSAEIIAQAKADKVVIFKKRRRHNYRRKNGHRQQHTILRIVAIGDHKAEKVEKKIAPAKEAVEAKPAVEAKAVPKPATKAKAAKPATKAKAAKPVTKAAKPAADKKPAAGKKPAADKKPAAKKAAPKKKDA